MQSRAFLLRIIAPIHPLNPSYCTLSHKGAAYLLGRNFKNWGKGWHELSKTCSFLTNVWRYLLVCLFPNKHPEERQRGIPRTAPTLLACRLFLLNNHIYLPRPMLQRKLSEALTRHLELTTYIPLVCCTRCSKLMGWPCLTKDQESWCPTCPVLSGFKMFCP